VLQQLGIRCAVFGPGRVEDVHKANESLPIRHWEAADDYLARLIRYFCGPDGA